MSKKIRVTSELVERARKIFANRESIKANEELSRGELRALERKGFVRRMQVVGERKYVGVTGSISYQWFWQESAKKGGQ